MFFEKIEILNDAILITITKTPAPACPRIGKYKARYQTRLIFIIYNKKYIIDFSDSEGGYKCYITNRLINMVISKFNICFYIFMF